MTLRFAVCRPATAMLTLGLIVHGAPAGASLLCKLYQWRAQDAHYQTTYRYSTDEMDEASKRYETLPEKGVYAIVRLYEITPETQEIKPCRNLAIVKRLFLQRKDDLDFVFNEINEFYTTDGTLIVTNTQNLTDQLAQTGYYVASDPLPIPQDAPPGRYQLVSKLVLTKKGEQSSFLLGSAQTEYKILPLR